MVYSISSHKIEWYVYTFSISLRIIIPCYVKAIYSAICCPSQIIYIFLSLFKPCCHKAKNYLLQYGESSANYLKQEELFHKQVHYLSNM